MLLLYNLVLWFYFAGIKAASPFNTKARQWRAGREKIFDKLSDDFGNVKTGKHKILWMHCASLGEFEQGRTVLEALKRRRPGLKVLLTFFSPSGFEIRKNYPGADWIYYLPTDTPAHAKRFLDIVQPDLVIFVKYEFWYHFLTEAKRRQIPVLLLSAVFRRGQPFFKWYGRLHRTMLGCFEKILVQHQDSQLLLQTLHFGNVRVIGDTRVDRVLEIASQPVHLPVIERFCSGHFSLICGSTWPEDEALILPLINGSKFLNWKFVIAPHEVTPSHLKEIENKLEKRPMRYAEVVSLDADSITTDAPVLLIDNIGMLSKIYKFGNVAYVGGGFGKGIHNILEPMAFGLPVLFGSNFKKFSEATAMAEAGGGFVVKSSSEMEAILKKLESPSNVQKAATSVNSYISQNKGATEKAVNEALRFV